MAVPGTVYRVIRPLGSGGMGDVYEVEHELLGLRRALKVLGRRMTGRNDLAERLRVEARALAGLRHPNLVEVHDLGVSSDGRVFYAMELLLGATLRELLGRHGGFKVGQACDVAAQVLDALGAAHARGMVHRDVKPENIFIQRNGVLKLLDFGVAKAVFGGSPTAPQTEAGVAVGTPRYMAPEQAEGKPVDPRTDLYCVGLLLWEMLVGKNPFAELDALGAAVATVLHGVPPLEEAGFGHLPEAVRAAVRKATQRRADDRYADAASFSAELRAWRRAQNETPPPPSALPSPSMRVPPGTVTRLDPIPVGAATELPPVDYYALGAMTRPAGAAPPADAALPPTMTDDVAGDFRSEPTRTSLGLPIGARGPQASGGEVGAAGGRASGGEVGAGRGRASGGEVGAAGGRASGGEVGTPLGTRGLRGQGAGAAAGGTLLPGAGEKGRGAGRGIPLPFWLLLPASAALSSAVTVGLLRPSLSAQGPCPPAPSAEGVALPAGAPPAANAANGANAANAT
ncbi:MAG TPA: serine/threonine-protein kinase, partial [Polyangiaceae bacterium]|nr:serine/threonine-protein kinase [Polyangiaceae bacterium]